MPGMETRVVGRDGVPRDLVVDEGVELLEDVDDDEDRREEEQSREQGEELLAEDVAVEEPHAGTAFRGRGRRLGLWMISAAWSVSTSPIAPITRFGAHIAIHGERSCRSASSSPPARQR